VNLMSNWSVIVAIAPMVQAAKGLAQSPRDPSAVGRWRNSNQQVGYTKWLQKVIITIMQIKITLNWTFICTHLVVFTIFFSTGDLSTLKTIKNIEKRIIISDLVIYCPIHTVLISVVYVSLTYLFSFECWNVM